MRNDLLFAVFVAIVINLAIWIVGAEILQPNGIEVKTLGDPGKALELFFGPIGWYIFFVGVFATSFASMKYRKARQELIARARTRIGDYLYPQISDEVGGRRRLVDQPPILFHIHEAGFAKRVKLALEDYRSSLLPERRFLYDRYRLEACRRWTRCTRCRSSPGLLARWGSPCNGRPMTAT